MALPSPLDRILDPSAVDLQCSNQTSLDSIGIKNGIDQSSAKHDYLKLYERQLANQLTQLSDIVIISGNNTVKTANTFAEFFVDSRIHVLSTSALSPDAHKELLTNVTLHICKDINSMHDVMILKPRPQVIIEDGNNTKSQKLTLFRELFFYLPAGGQYMVEDLHASFIPGLADIEGDDIADLIERLMRHKRSPRKMLAGVPADDLALSSAVESYQIFGKIAFITKTGDHLFKLREHEANAALEANLGSAWGSTISVAAESERKSRAHVSSNRSDLGHRFKHILQVPKLQLREYFGVTCQARQVCYLGGFLLPDSFRHSGARRLGNVALQDSSARFAQAKSKPIKKFLEGNFYYLDTEYPGHFGHVMTEVVARLWGWSAAREAFPGIRVLISLGQGQNSIPGYQREIFEAFNIDDSMITYIAPDEEVTVDRLVAATPQFSNPNWSAPGLIDVWTKIRESASTDAAPFPERVFISRKQETTRSCNNTDQLEDFFVDHGFAIVYPEKLSFSDQVNLFASSKVVAGFGGSGLFGAMFAKNPGTRIVIAGETYIAMNEYLISSVLGDEMHYFWCKSDKQYPKGAWTAEAFKSNFTFNFETDGERLKTLLKGLK